MKPYTELAETFKASLKDRVKLLHLWFGFSSKEAAVSHSEPTLSRDHRPLPLPATAGVWELSLHVTRECLLGSLSGGQQLFQNHW